jgi:DNA-binding NarL/FixJ family response regulator/class 3 adenylate cyclase
VASTVLGIQGWHDPRIVATTNARTAGAATIPAVVETGFDSEGSEGQRVLATVLFTDIVGSTDLASRLGDREWKGLLQAHHRVVRSHLERLGGREMDTAGDGFFAVFDAPGRAIECATAIIESLRELGIDIRAAVHMGECEVIGGKLGGIAVHVGARILSTAGSGELRVSSTVRDVVAGRGIEFRDQGIHTLKGITGQWHLYSVIGDPGVSSPRVVVADDVMLMREGIVRLLREASYDVVGQAEDLDGLMRSVRLTRPDAVVVDIRMPPTHTDEGLVAAKQIRQEYPNTGVLVLSQYVEPRYATELIEDYPERVGYLLKERVFDVAILVDALRRIADGECVVDPTIVSRLFGRKRREDPLSVLTEKEKEVLGLVAEGMSNHAIAARLSESEDTVEAHISQVFSKLDLPESPEQHRRVLAVLAFLRG